MSRKAKQPEGVLFTFWNHLNWLQLMKRRSSSTWSPPLNGRSDSNSESLSSLLMEEVHFSSLYAGSCSFTHGPYSITLMCGSDKLVNQTLWLSPLFTRTDRSPGCTFVSQLSPQENKQHDWRQKTDVFLDQPTLERSRFSAKNADAALILNR